MLPHDLQMALHPLVVCALVANVAAFALAAVTGATWSGVLAGFVAKGAGMAQGSGTMLLSLLSVVILTFAFRIYGQRALLKRRARARRAPLNPGACVHLDARRHRLCEA